MSESVETQILKLSAAVEQTPDRVLITALDGRIEYVNPAFERATGYKAREVLGRSPAILKSGAHSPEFYRTMWKTILAGRTFKAEFTNRRRDGSMLFEEQTITPLRDQKGNVTHFISTGRDISEWKRTCAALRESEDRHRLLFESPQPIWVFDLESLRFLAVNPAAVALYGFSEEEFLGMTLTDIRPEEDIPEFLSAVRTFAATVSVPGFDSSELVNVGVTRHKAKDGRILDVEIRSRPITCQGRSAAIVLPTDITERLKSERSLRECQERFRQLSENVKEVFWIQDLATDRLLYVSPSFDRIWGRQHTSMQTSKDFLETVHPEDRDAVVNYFYILSPV